MGSHHKKKKKTQDVNVVIADISRDADQEASKAALQPSYEGNTYIVPSRTMIDFVNVTESTDPSQTGGGGPPDSIPPATVTGLLATASSSSQINLSWTANTEPDLSNYNVYRGTSTGFVVTLGVTPPVGTPSTNSFADTGRTASTTYYYRVSAVDFSANIGPLSTEANATTLAAGAVTPTLELHLDSSFLDTSPNNFAQSGNNGNGFILPGQFGTAGWKCNYPSILAPKDIVTFGGSGASKPVALNMDTSVGFSISLWVFPQDISALPRRRVIAVNRDDASNSWIIPIDSAGVAYFFVQKGGVDYKAQVSGFTTGSWQHLAATFNGATNTAIIYRNAVAGISSSATPEYAFTGSGSLWDMHIGYDYTNPSSDSVYQGYYDEYRYYKSVVLTPTQVTNLKNTNGP